MTALQGFESLIDEFSLEEICSKILGHLAISLMDRKLSKVRKEAKEYSNCIWTLWNPMQTCYQKEMKMKTKRSVSFQKFSPASVPSNNTSTDNVVQQEIQVTIQLHLLAGMVSKFTSLGGEMNKDFNRSTPDITRATSPQLLLMILLQD